MMRHIAKNDYTSVGTNLFIKTSIYFHFRSHNHFFPTTKKNKDSSSFCYDPPQQKVVEIVQFLKCCSLQNQKIKCTLIQRVPHCTTTSSLINATLCRQLNSSKNYDNVGASPDVFKLFVLFWPPKTLTPPEIVKFANLSHQ